MLAASRHGHPLQRDPGQAQRVATPSRHGRRRRDPTGPLGWHALTVAVTPRAPEESGRRVGGEITSRAFVRAHAERSKSTGPPRALERCPESLAGRFVAPDRLAGPRLRIDLRGHLIRRSFTIGASARSSIPSVRGHPTARPVRRRIPRPSPSTRRCPVAIVFTFGVDSLFVVLLSDLAVGSSGSPRGDRRSRPSPRRENRLGAIRPPPLVA